MSPFYWFAFIPILASCTGGISNPVESSSLPDSVPITWQQAGEGNQGEISEAWLEEFGSQKMHQLVNEALTNNPNLKATEATLKATWATVSKANAELFPTSNASTGVTRRRTDDGNSNANYSVAANISWEPDLWGSLRDSIELDQANYRADAYELRNARLSLAANTARAWCNLVTAQQQLELASSTLKSFEKNNRIVERNYKAGIPGTRSLAVQLSRSNVASAKSTLRDRQLQRGNSARTLELLLGRYPSAELQSSNTLPSLKRETPSSFPATVLNRRPDVKAAELDVYASAKQADIARKNLLPSVRLTSSVSSASNVWGNIFNPSNIVANAAANLTHTIYDGGQLKAEAQAALERNSAALYRFSDIVLAAAEEVEGALATDQALREQEIFLKEETKSSTLAEVQAGRDYSEGIDGVGILEILESQRRANTARSSLINIRNQRLQNRIALHLALGGDYMTQAQ